MTSLFFAFRAALLIAVIIVISYTYFGPADIHILDNETTTESSSKNGNRQLPVNFLIALPLTDEPETNWTLPQITEEDIKAAIEAGKEALGDKDIIEATIVAPALNTPSYRHQKSVSTTREARMASKRGYVEDHATRYLMKKYNIERKYDKRRDVGGGPSSKLHLEKQLDCGSPMKYRTYDGTCNNQKHPRWGSSYIPFRRALNPDYCDGVSLPRCATDGKELASAREISITVHRPSYYTDPHFTVMLAVFGQFLDHDITATALNQGQDGEPIECCTSTDPIHPECFPVPLGEGDPYFDDYNITCMNFVRSVPAPTDRLGPREQYNQATAYIDGSVVYGSTDEKVNSLRAMKDGQLKMYLTVDNRTLLPGNDLNAVLLVFTNFS